MTMNREIKFRAWDKENNQWVYGYYTKLPDGATKFDYIISDIDGSLTRFFIQDIQSLGQSAGLKDKNGVEVFEGDLVKYTNPRHYSEKGVFQIKFDKGAFAAGYHTGSSTAKRPKLIIGGRVEVIGNIYQNPELLTQPTNE